MPTRPAHFRRPPAGSPAAVGIAAAAIGVSAAYGVAALPWRGGAPELAGLLRGLGLDAVRLGEGRWQLLVTHWLLHVSWLHLLVSAALLLTAGVAVERAWGTVRFLTLFMAGGMAVVLLSLASGWVPTTGATGPALGLVGAACAIESRRRFFGRLHARWLWISMGASACALLAGLELSGTGFHYATHIVALPLGAAAGLAGPAWRAWQWDRYLHRGLADLHEEHVVRERVDALLARIVAEGEASLSRADRRFLKKASRYFAGGAERRVATPGRRPSRVDTPI